MVPRFKEKSALIADEHKYMILQFFKNARLLAAAEIILKLKALILIPLLTRHFGAVNYGAWTQVSVLISTMAPLIFLGTSQSIIRFLPGRSLVEQKRNFSAWMVMLLTISLIICGSLLIWKRDIAILFFGQANEYEILLPLAAATLFVNMIRNAAAYWYQVLNNAKMFSVIVVSQALVGLFAVAAILIRNEGVYELVIYTLVGDIIFILWILVRISRDYGWAWPDFSIVPGLLKYGLPLFPSGYAQWGLNSMDRLFLVSYATLADVGVYGLAYALGYLVIPLLVRPVRAMYPSLAAELYNKGDLRTLQRLFNHSAGTSLALSVPAAVGLSVLGVPILTFIATDDFIRGAPLVGLIALGYIFNIIADYYDISLGLVHRQYWSTVSIVVACGLNLVLNMILIPKYLIWGAAIATNLSFLTQLILSFLFAHRYNILITKFDFPVKVFLASILMGILLLGFKTYLFDGRTVAPLPEIIILGFIGVVSYMVCLYVFKIIYQKRIFHFFI